MGLGVIFDLDSFLKNAGLKPLEENLGFAESPKFPASLRGYLEKLSSNGALIAVESSLSNWLLGSLIYLYQIPCDIYIGGDADTSQQTRWEVFMSARKNKTIKWLYLSEQRYKQEFASEAGLECINYFELGLMSHANQKYSDRKRLSPEEYWSYIESASSRVDKIGLPLLPASLITTREIKLNDERWVHFAKPLLQELLHTKLAADIGVWFLAPYMRPGSNNELGFRLWKRIKNWDGNTSGPKPNLLDLNLVATAMFAHLEGSAFDAVVSVPSRATSKATPASASIRLGNHLSNLLGVPTLPALTREAHQEFRALKLDALAHMRTVLLVDDQCTSGKTFAAARTALEALLPETVIVNWSWSKSV
jgi:hypothetical protein